MCYKINFRNIKYSFVKLALQQNVSRKMWKNVSKIQQKNQNSKEKTQMETRIEKMSLETIGAVERENTLLIVM